MANRWKGGLQVVQMDGKEINESGRGCALVRVNEGGMNGGCLMAGRVLGKKRKEKSFSFSVFPGWRRELLSAPLSNCPVRGRAFFLPYLAQTRKDQRLAGLRLLATGMLFSLAPDQPHFSSSSTCKVSPLGNRYCTNFGLAVRVRSEGAPMEF